MRGKLIPESASIMQVLYSQAFCIRTLPKWSQFSFSSAKQVPCVNNAYPRFQIYTTKYLDLLCPRSAQTLARPTEDVFLELKKLLNSGHIRRRDVDKVIKEQSAYKELNNSVLVLQCISKLPDISPKNRVALAEQFFNEIKSVTGIVTEAHCLQVLDCYLQSKYFENLDSFLSLMEMNNVKPSEKIQLVVLKCLVEKGKNKEVSALAKKFHEANFENNEELYATTIYNLGLLGDIKKAFEEIKKMKENNITIGNKIYTSLFKALALKGDKSLMENLTRDVLLEGVTFSDDQILSILENVALSKQYSLITDVKMLCVDEVFLKISQILLVKLLYSGNIESTYALMNYLLTLNYICESSDKQLLFNGMCKSFIEESCNLNYSVDDLVEKCKQLEQLNKCCCPLEYALYYYMKKRDIPGSLMILQAMYDDDLPIEAHYFWPLFIMSKEKFGDEGIIFILDKMNELKVPFTAETLTDYVFPNMSDILFVKTILQKVESTEAQLQLMTEVFLLYTIKERLFKEGLMFVAEYPLSENRTYKFLEKYLVAALLENPHCEDIIKLAKITGALDPLVIITKLWSQGDKHEIKQLSECFRKHEIYIKNIEQAELLLKLNENILLQRAVSLLLNKDGMNTETNTKSLKIKKNSRFEECKKVENAEIVLAELEAKNMNTVGQRLRLVKMYLHEQLFDKAVKTKNELLEIMGPNPELSPGFLMIFARVAAYEGDVDKAIQYFNLLRNKYPYFPVGNIAGLSMCVVFMQHNCYEEMLTVLRILPKWEGNPESISAKPVQLLREVATLGMPELTDVVFKIMLQKKFVEIDVNSLQAYTKSYLYANDLDGAVKEYERIAKEHNIVSNTTPILWSAVQSDRFDLVDRVTQLYFRKANNKASLVSSLTMVASKGDPKFLLSYSEKLRFPLDDNFMVRKFLEGKIPSLPLIAFKTLITAAMIKRLPYEYIVQGAIISLMSDRNYDGATELLNFCKSKEIKLKEEHVIKLKTYSELGEVAAALVPLKRRGKRKEIQPPVNSRKSTNN